LVQSDRAPFMEHDYWDRKPVIVMCREYRTPARSAA
jgi:hypothetical protein